MKKRIVAWIFIILIPLLTAVTFAGAGPEDYRSIASAAPDPSGMSFALETVIKERFPFADRLKELCFKIKKTGGKRIFDDIIYTDDGLIKLYKPSSQRTESNIEAITEFAERGGISTYLMILPTAAAIYQNKLPSYMNIFNEKDYIDMIGQKVSGKLNYINVYLPLIFSKGEYIYLKTDTRLTSLGQYRVYETVADRLGFTARRTDEFTLFRIPGEYYGNLAENWPYGELQGDVITYYKENDFGDSQANEYTVTTIKDGIQENRVGLFDTQAAALNGMDVFLGGESDIAVVVNKTRQKLPSLLIFGDSATVGIVPYLAAHYNRIVFADMSKLTSDEIAGIFETPHDQLLFAYSIETMTNTSVPARIGRLTE